MLEREVVAMGSYDLPHDLRSEPLNVLIGAECYVSQTYRWK